MRKKTIGRWSGFMLADALFALGAAGLMIAILGVAVTRAARAQTSLTQRRSAIRGAEAALCELQAGRTIPQMDGKTFAVHDLPAIPAPAGHRWIEVEAHVGSQRAALDGIVPAERGGQ